MMRNDYTDGRGRPLQPDTAVMLKALKVVRSFPDVVNNSGTPTGQTFAEGIPAGLAKLVGNKAGAEMYFGNLGRAGRAAAGSRAGQVGIGLAGYGAITGGQ